MVIAEYVLSENAIIVVVAVVFFANKFRLMMAFIGGGMRSLACAHSWMRTRVQRIVK